MDREILRILPELEENPSKYRSCISRLTTLGVQNVKDFEHVELDELLGEFTIVQARKLIKASKPIGPTELSSGNSTSPVWSCSSSSSSVNSSEPCWVFDFTVPWSKCSSAMLELLGKGEPPNPMQRRQLVHETIDEVLKITSKPGRKNIERIAFSIVAKYPDSFRDAIDGVSIGNGHGSLTNELFNRWENTMRKKRKLDSSDTSSASEPTKKPYGCVNWKPPAQDAADNNNMKTWLCEEFKKARRDTPHVITLMEKTYAAQREFINTNVSVQTVLSHWPFLSDSMCLFQHSGILLKKDEMQNLPDTMTRRSFQIYKVLKTSKKPCVVGAITSIKKQCKTLGNSVAKSVEIICLLAAQLDENPDFIARTIKDDCSFDELLNELPASPVLVAIGVTFATSQSFKLVVENQLVMAFDDFFVGLASLFCYYYVFNMEYPLKAVATLEFIQRFFVGINAKGSKCTSSKHHKYAHPKVLSLVKKMNAAKKFFKETE